MTALEQPDTGHGEDGTLTWHGLYVEWDEPGAGAICKDGKRLIHFGIETDWSDPWDPLVNEDGLALIDQFPRMLQEIDMATETAKKYEAEWRNALVDDDEPDDGEPTERIGHGPDGVLDLMAALEQSVADAKARRLAAEADDDR